MLFFLDMCELHSMISGLHAPKIMLTCGSQPMIVQEPVSRSHLNLRLDLGDFKFRK